MACWLQQYLPLAVLKPAILTLSITKNAVATVPTACGIETVVVEGLTIEVVTFIKVATVPTACGIETTSGRYIRATCKRKLQQYLPLAVLKHCRVTLRHHS